LNFLVHAELLPKYQRRAGATTQPPYSAPLRLIFSPAWRVSSHRICRR
jgi:hypothetical protein